jgi:hypothetical protein
MILQMGNDEELPVIIEPADRNLNASESDIATSSQTIFHVAIEKGSLSTASSRGSLYLIVFGSLVMRLEKNRDQTGP